MALVTGQTWTADIPHEPGQTMTFRELSWLELEKAAQVKRRSVLAELKDLGELIKSLPQGQTLPGAGVDYDTLELLRAGIVSWTYPVEVNDQNIRLLDRETAEWAVMQIKQSHSPKTETERKNG